MKTKELAEFIRAWEKQDYTDPTDTYNFVYKVFKQYRHPRILPVIEQRDLKTHQIVFVWKIIKHLV